METLKGLFGDSEKLDCLQMCDRGTAVFLISLLLIRLSGRRSFGIRTPLDNIIVILLGAILSRAVVGASPFVPVIITCFVIVLLHRAFGWLIVKSKKFGDVVEGQKILLFSNEKFDEVNMEKALVGKEDVMQGVRKSALTENLRNIDKVYMERNGEISSIKKDIH